MVNDMNNNIITNASNPIVDGKAPHLKCTKQEISDIVLLPGDPARVKMVGSLCEKLRYNRRESRIYCWCWKI